MQVDGDDRGLRVIHTEAHQPSPNDIVEGTIVCTPAAVNHLIPLSIDGIAAGGQTSDV